MKKPCNCFEKTLEEFKNKCVTPQMGVTPHVQGSLTTDWANRVFFFSESPAIPIPLKIVTEYRPIKKNGEPAKGKTKLENYFTMSYCPFCGTRWKPYSINDIADYLSENYIQIEQIRDMIEFEPVEVDTVIVNWFKNRDDEQNLIVLRVVFENGDDIIASFDESNAKRFCGINY